MKRSCIVMLIFLLIMQAPLFVSEAARETKAPLKNPSSSISHLQLKGTLFTGSLKPLAIIQDTRTNRAMMYELGDIIDGAELIHIARGEVILQTSQGRKKLVFPEGGISQLTATSASETDWYKVIRQGDTFIINEATVSGAISRIVDIMKNVRIGPYFVDGAPSGIILTTFIPQGILKEIGVKEGDVVKSVNNLTLNSPYQMFNAYKCLKDKKELTLEIIRDSKPLVLTYRIIR